MSSSVVADSCGKIPPFIRRFSHRFCNTIIVDTAANPTTAMTINPYHDSTIISFAKFPDSKVARFQPRMHIYLSHVDATLHLLLWIHSQVCDLMLPLHCLSLLPHNKRHLKLLVINQKCIRDGRIDLSEARRHDSRADESKYIQHGDALINSTGVGTLGRVAVVEFKPENITVDSHVTICRADPEKIDAFYLAYTVAKLQQYFEFMAAGSTGQVELNKSLIEGIKVLVPEKMKSLIVQKQILFRQVEILEKTKSQLLPRLISGKLSVEELDIQFPPSMQEEVAA